MQLTVTHLSSMVASTAVNDASGGFPWLYGLHYRLYELILDDSRQYEEVSLVMKLPMVLQIRIAMLRFCHISLL